MLSWIFELKMLTKEIKLTHETRADDNKPK